MKSTPDMRARIRELMEREQDDYDRAVDCVLEDLETSLVRIEALEAALRRIDAIIDSPASFNQDIEDVCRAVLAPEQDK